MLKISTRYKRLAAKEFRIAQAIRALQEECTHPNLIKVANASTGNYDPSSDYYWYECSCPDCNKRWNEPQ